MDRLEAAMGTSSSSSNERISLEVLSLASPCDASWESMAGNERARFCKHCQKHVHNLSAMPRDEAERLVCEAAGSLCVRYARDEAGRVMTLDYEPMPNGRKRRWWVVSLSAGSVAAAIAGALWGWASPKPKPTPVVVGALLPPSMRSAPAGQSTAGCDSVLGKVPAPASSQPAAPIREDDDAP
jgi:hypothetical protein